MLSHFWGLTYKNLLWMWKNKLLSAVTIGSAFGLAGSMTQVDPSMIPMAVGLAAGSIAFLFMPENIGSEKDSGVLRAILLTPLTFRNYIVVQLIFGLLLIGAVLLLTLPLAPNTGSMGWSGLVALLFLLVQYLAIGISVGVITRKEQRSILAMLFYFQVIFFHSFRAIDGFNPIPIRFLALFPEYHFSQLFHSGLLLDFNTTAFHLVMAIAISSSIVYTSWLLLKMYFSQSKEYLRLAGGVGIVLIATVYSGYTAPEMETQFPSTEIEFVGASGEKIQIPVESERYKIEEKTVGSIRFYHLTSRFDKDIKLVVGFNEGEPRNRDQGDVRFIDRTSINGRDVSRRVRFSKFRIQQYFGTRCGKVSIIISAHTRYSQTQLIEAIQGKITDLFQKTVWQCPQP